MAAPDPPGRLGLLPPERRLEIYRHALTTDQSITITQSRRKNPAYALPAQPGTVAPPKTISTPRGTVLVPNDKKRKKVDVARGGAGCIIAVNLVQTSKHIFAEAAPVLYGSNVFLFDNGPALQAFFERLGSRAAMLARVLCYLDTEMALLRRMARPKLIELEPRWSISYSAGNPFGSDGEAGMSLELPKELQLRRLEAVSFPAGTVKNGRMRWRGLLAGAATVQDEQAATALRDKVAKRLSHDAKKAREQNDARKRLIDKMLQESRARK